jgi:hypothetical protein
MDLSPTRTRQRVAALSADLRVLLDDEDYEPGEDVDADAIRQETTNELLNVLDFYLQLIESDET